MLPRTVAIYDAFSPCTPRLLVSVRGDIFQDSPERSGKTRRVQERAVFTSPTQHSKQGQHAPAVHVCTTFHSTVVRRSHGKAIAITALPLTVRYRAVLLCGNSLVDRVAHNEGNPCSVNKHWFPRRSTSRSSR